jgi:MFS family permease
MTTTTREAGETPGPHAYYVLAMLFLVLATSLIDRNILGILLVDIKADLQISDTRIGLLTGPAFAITNAIAGIPLARMADRWSRRGIIAWGLLAWSVLTASQGLTRSFGALLVARIGVGIGEATTGPRDGARDLHVGRPRRRLARVPLRRLAQRRLRLADGARRGRAAGRRARVPRALHRAGAGAGRDRGAARSGGDAAAPRARRRARGQADVPA